MASCCCDFVSNDVDFHVYNELSATMSKEEKGIQMAECRGNWCRVSSSTNLCMCVLAWCESLLLWAWMWVYTSSHTL